MEINLGTMEQPIKINRAGLPSDPQCQKLLDNIQGNFIKEHGRDNVLLLFLVFKDQSIKQIKTFIAEIFNHSDLITSCNQQLLDGKRYRTWRKGKSPKSDFQEKLFINFALTSKGYALLGVDKDHLPLDPDGFFTQGRSASPDWEQSYRQDIHAVMLLALDDKRLPDLGAPDKWAAVPERKKSSALKKAAEIKGEWEQLAVVFPEVGRTIYNKKVDVQNTPDDPRKPVEHFGFMDGISNPLFFEEELREWEKREKIPRSHQNYYPLTPLASVLTKDPNGDQYGYGSYLAFLKLEQNVNQFNALTDQLRKKLNVTQELTQAYVVGRFEDGTPVLLQDKPGKGVVNNFNFSNDVEGMSCPVHAHIRKVNRRIGESTESDQRIVRRGITFGDREIQYDDKGNLILGQTNGPVGLLFMSFQESIRMFHKMFSIWAGDGKPTTGNAFDPIIGHGNNDQRWPIYGQEANVTIFRFADVVTERGGQYFFAPSVSFLKNL